MAQILVEFAGREFTEFCAQEGKTVQLWQQEVNRRAADIMESFPGQVGRAVLGVLYVQQESGWKLRGVLTFQVALSGSEESNVLRDQAIDRMSDMDIRLNELGWHNLDIAHAPIESAEELYNWGKGYLED